MCLRWRRTISTGGQVLGLILINLFLDEFVFTGISIGAHIGGLIAGVLIMLAYLRFRGSAQLSVAAATAVLLASIAIAYAVI